MKNRVATGLIAGLGVLVTFGTSAEAAKLPPIVASTNNAVPQCVTPGRLMAFLKSRNKRLSPKFTDVATEYMRHGEQLGVRWDLGFFQMMVETDSLRFGGDVKAYQNNFAGLGATGGGVRGESFETVSKGARAHLQHTLMYAGTFIDDPVAERTRKVQEWKVLDKWRSRLPKPVTFTHLTRKWAPGDRGYSNDIQAIANVFRKRFCDIADPQPDLVAKARGEKFVETASVKPSSTLKDDASRSSLGGPSLAQGLSKSFGDNYKNYKVINKKSDTAAAKLGDTQPTTKTKTAKTAKDNIKTASLAGAATKTAGAFKSSKPNGKCKVWTASYGGSKAVIIKALGDNGTTNFTVLDVNKGREKREADAYISAYAKGGASVGEFGSQNLALNKAFELCPEE